MTAENVERQTLETVARIVQLLDARGLRCALVGAAALAVHGYSRATEDVDLGVATPSLDALRSCADEIRTTLKLDVEIAMPDADDPLGGVITATGARIRQIQIVNFVNPLGMGDHPGREAIAQSLALRLHDASAHVVDLAHLVAMKLYAGGMKSKADVVELLGYNPDADLHAIGALCSRFALAHEWAALVPEIEARRSRAR
ncbi:MAG TPA: nucleotidyl transferase AbiEii/AbiGii toxin family protein [Myxococcota bacterium]